MYDVLFMIYDVGTWRATLIPPFVILRSLRRRISVTPTLCFQILRDAQDDIRKHPRIINHKSYIKHPTS